MLNNWITEHPNCPPFTSTQCTQTHVLLPDCYY